MTSADEKMGRLLGMSEDITTRVADNRLISNSLIGIEIEALNIPNDLWDTRKTSKWPYKYWKLVEDGSVRGGGEFVLRQPLAGTDLIQALEEFKTIHDKAKLKFDYQTSVHIHLDTRGLKLKDFKNLMSLYVLVEPLLFQVCGEERADNIFCLSIKNAPTNVIDLVSSIGYAINSEDYYPIGSELMGSSRYTSLNFGSLNKFGSLEFRGHHGTADTEAILRWINIILTLECYAKENPDIERAIQSISAHGFRRTIEAMFGDLLPFDSAVEGELWDNLRFVHKMLYLYEVENNVPVLFNKGVIQKGFLSPHYQYLKQRSGGKIEDSIRRKLVSLFIQTKTSILNKNPNKDKKVVKKKKKKRLSYGRRDGSSRVRGADLLTQQVRLAEEERERARIRARDAATAAVSDIANEFNLDDIYIPPSTIGTTGENR